MKKPKEHADSIRESLIDSPDCGSRFLWSARNTVSLSEALLGTSLGGRASELAGRSVLIATRDQLEAARVLIELDGSARRLIICPPDVSPVDIPGIVEQAEVDAVVLDISLLTEKRWREALESSVRLNRIPEIVPIASLVAAAKLAKMDPLVTEWVLLTSGTSGAPKMVVHSFATLTAAIREAPQQDGNIVWGTFYDIRRYGGLQIFLRALLGTGSLVLSDAVETLTDHLLRLSLHSVTHLTGTPSHWRRALMNPMASVIAPRYARLSGEIVDQGILNMLHVFYPDAAIGHAFASTEAGVAFEVTDGLEGFPADFVGRHGGVDIKIEDNSLRIRSARTATHFLGTDKSTLRDSEGFVDTGDIVERRGNRYFFLGRRSGVINVGGLKVHPEEIEVLLNGHPAVQISCVRPQRNPITGSLVVADVVLKSGRDFEEDHAELKDDILKACRERLPRHKVPAVLNFVPALNLSAAGKMTRHNA